MFRALLSGSSSLNTSPLDPAHRFVEMSVSLPLSAAEFTAEKQGSFKEGVAAAAGVDAGTVEITGVREVETRRSARLEGGHDPLPRGSRPSSSGLSQAASFSGRRLLATSIEVQPPTGSPRS